MDIEELDASREVLGAAIRKVFGERDMSQVQDELNTALKVHVDSSPVRNSGAWLFVNVGLDDQGKVQGMFGVGGTTLTLMMLQEYLSDQLQIAIESQGGCVCTDCKVSALLRLLDDQEKPYGPKH